MSGTLENPAAIKTKQNITKKKKDFACYTTIIVLSLLLLLKKPLTLKSHENLPRTKQKKWWKKIDYWTYGQLHL